MISYGDEKQPYWTARIYVQRWIALAYNVVIAIALLLLAAQAHAGEAVLTWTAPTQNTDGTPLTDLAGFKIYLGQTQGGPYPVSIDIPDPAATTFTVPNLTDGVTYYFVSTAYNSAATVQESDYSNEVSKTIPFPVPMPPSNLTVDPGNLTAFDIVKQKDKYVLLAVGTVPAGTECNPAQTVNGHYGVPSDLVQWFGNVQPPVVVADCS